MEAILTYNIIPTAGSNVLARRTGGLSAWLATNSVSNTGGGVAGANPVAVAGIPTVAQTEGTKRAILESYLQTVVQNCWTNGGQPSMVLCGAHNKQAISAFTGIAAQRFQAPSGATTIIGAADIYVIH
jgi:folylpolyglutamate synthase/dihydropteroate synthase